MVVLIFVSCLVFVVVVAVVVVVDDENSSDKAYKLALEMHELISSFILAVK